MKKILSIDGGGMKGLFSATLLAEIEKNAGIRICDYFDLIAGTSTGAIIAAALALGMPAEKIQKLYLERARVIFPSQRWRYLRQIFGGKYSSKALKEVLEQEFGDSLIGNCETRLLIPAFNITAYHPQVFKTSHAKDLRYDYRKKIWSVLLATTAAPTYFEPYKTKWGAYIDGGIGANNPSALAVVEGISKLGWEKSDIRLLSIGCTPKAINHTTGEEKMGVVNVGKLINLFMDGESQYSNNIAKFLLGENQIIRISPNIATRNAALDSSNKMTLDKLVSSGLESAQNEFDKINGMFLQERKEKFEPVYKLEV